jgi:hypothetical protein
MHDTFTEMEEFRTDQRLGHKIGNHRIRWTVFNLHFVPLNQIGDVKVLDVEVSSTLSGASLAILLKFHRTRIIAINHCHLHLVALSFDE